MPNPRFVIATILLVIATVPNTVAQPVSVPDHVDDKVDTLGASQSISLAKCIQERERAFGRRFPAMEYCQYLWYRKQAEERQDSRFITLRPGDPEVHVPRDGHCYPLWLGVKPQLQSWFKMQVGYVESDMKNIKGNKKACQEEIQRLKKRTEMLRDAWWRRDKLPEMNAVVDGRKVQQLRTALADYEKQLKSAAAKLSPKEQRRSEEATDQCKRYDIALSDEERNWLAQCDPATLRKIAQLNDKNRLQHATFTNQKRVLEASTTRAEAGLDENQKATRAGKEALERCGGFDAARLALRKLRHNQIPLSLFRLIDHCEPNLRTAAEALNAQTDEARQGSQDIVTRIERLQREFQQRRHTLKRKIHSSKSHVKYCEWPVLNRHIAEIRESLPDAACWEEFPGFAELSRQVDEIESQANQRHDEVRWRKAKMATLLAHIRQHLASRHKTDKPLQENEEALRQLLRDAKREGYADCMLELVAEADEMLDLSRGRDACIEWQKQYWKHKAILDAETGPARALRVRINTLAYHHNANCLKLGFGPLQEVAVPQK